MRIAKRAEQRNVRLAREFYTTEEINEMLLNEEIAYFDKAYNECYKPITNKYDADDKIFVIFTQQLISLDVKLIGGFYNVVATGLNGKEYMVEL